MLASPNAFAISARCFSLSPVGLADPEIRQAVAVVIKRILRLLHKGIWRTENGSGRDKEEGEKISNAENSNHQIINVIQISCVTSLHHNVVWHSLQL